MMTDDADAARDVVVRPKFELSDESSSDKRMVGHYLDILSLTCCSLLWVVAHSIIAGKGST